jgi:hypothetical protein
VGDGQLEPGAGRIGWGGGGGDGVGFVHWKRRAWKPAYNLISAGFLHGLEARVTRRILHKLGKVLPLRGGGV